MLLQKKLQYKTLQIKFSIKQAFFINEIFSSRVKAAKQKEISLFLRGLAFFSKFEIFTT